MKTCLSDVQTFVGMKLMTGNVSEQKEEVKLLVTDMASLGLKFEPSLNIQTIIENIESYGATTMATSKHCATFVEPKVEQAQLNTSPVKTSEGIQLQLRTRINLKYTPSSISSCLILPDKQIMILDRKKNYLIIYNVNGTHDRDIAVHDKPYDASIIDRRTVAVTFTVEEIISIVDIKSNRIIRNIEIAGKWYSGISYHNGKLYALSLWEGIDVLDLSGCIIKTFPVDVNLVYKLVTSNQNIIYTHGKGDICCLSSNGTKTCIYSSSNQNQSVSSITADEKGNIYAVHPQSNILIAISNDGKTQTVLLTEEDGLKKPEAVNYNKEQKLLLICSGENKHAELYDVRL
ncbi:unnamed protein product [Mytilus edulis]|uniref:Uncharacterized protein n=1 Tax=Mytilus edulis TaxID=6550 RepID=A0A8S3RA08_MYTED|nr:unnamed protein product [Mytilus edulis]